MDESCGERGWCEPSNAQPHIYFEQLPSSTQSPVTTHLIAHTVDRERMGQGIVYVEETRGHTRKLQNKGKQGPKPHGPSSHLSRWLDQTWFLWTWNSSDVGAEGGYFLPVRMRNQCPTASVMVTVEGLEEDYSRVLHGTFLWTATFPPGWRVPSKKEVEVREHEEVKKKKRFLRAPDWKYKKRINTYRLWTTELPKGRKERDSDCQAACKESSRAAGFQESLAMLGWAFQGYSRFWVIVAPCK